jgi:hypothetical protein
VLKRPVGKRGLFLVLALYLACVAGYLQWNYWSTPEYQALQAYDRAWAILGPAEGRTTSKEQLVAAYGYLLEAARLAPQVTRLHEQLERLNWRFDERKFAMPAELRARAHAVSMLWKRIQEERQPILAVGVRERGWAPDQLRDGPGKAVRWSLIGVLVILGGWAYVRFDTRRDAELKRDQALRQVEQEVRELAGHRADTDPEQPVSAAVAPAGKPRRKPPAKR